MTKEAVAETLEGIAQLLDLKGENNFKIRAYQNAARAVETYAGDLDEAARKGELDRIEGIGKSVAEKIAELVTTGHLTYFDELRAEFPPGLFDLFGINGLGAKKIKALHEKLGIASVEDLLAACRDGRVAELPGFGEKTAQKLIANVEQRQRNAAFHRLATWPGKRSASRSFCAGIRRSCALARAAVSGGARRSCATWISSRPPKMPRPWAISS